MRSNLRKMFINICSVQTAHECNRIGFGNNTDAKIPNSNAIVSYPSTRLLKIRNLGDTLRRCDLQNKFADIRLNRAIADFLQIPFKRRQENALHAWSSRTAMISSRPTSGESAAWSIACANAMSSTISSIILRKTSAFSSKTSATASLMACRNVSSN